MAGVQIPWAEGAQYIKLVCRLGEPKPDSLSDQDIHPDLMTQAGTVRLTCNAKRIRYTESDGRSRMLSIDTWVFAIRESDGELYSVDDGSVGVEVLSGASAGCDPSGFTWTAVVTPVRGDSWTAAVPANATGTFDLCDGADVPLLAPGSNTITQRVAELEINKDAALLARDEAVAASEAAWLSQLAAESAKSSVDTAKMEVDQTAAEFSTAIADAQAILDDVPPWWAGTQTAYNALGTYDPNKLYLIIGA